MSEKTAWNPAMKSNRSATGARSFRFVPARSILRFVFMAAPKFFAAHFANREIKIANGPAKKDI